MDEDKNLREFKVPVTWQVSASVYNHIVIKTNISKYKVFFNKKDDSKTAILDIEVKN